jgi:hypothetical protein
MRAPRMVFQPSSAQSGHIINKVGKFARPQVQSARAEEQPVGSRRGGRACMGSVQGAFPRDAPTNAEGEFLVGEEVQTVGGMIRSPAARSRSSVETFQG